MSNLKNLQKKLGVSFEDTGLLKEAITHRSYINENKNWNYRNNERLEFLGDAVLELTVTEGLFKRLKDKEEGEMTMYRAALVNTRALADVANEIGLDKEILLSRGEARDFAGRGKEGISADAVEAVIGAIYLDRGYESAKKFVDTFVMSRFNDLAKEGVKDSKSLVQELAQSEYKITPTYKVLSEEGPAHERVFEVGLYFNEELKSRGEGNSKQEAETNAAQKFLDKS